MHLAVPVPDVYFNLCRSQFTYFTAAYEFSKFKVCSYYHRDKYQHLTECVGFLSFVWMSRPLTVLFPLDNRIQLAPKVSPMERPLGVSFSIYMFAKQQEPH